MAWRNALHERFFGGSAEVVAVEEAKADERRAAQIDLVSRHGFGSEVIGWLEAEVRRARVIAGPHEDMLVRAGFRDGIEHVLDHMKLLQQTAKES